MSQSRVRTGSDPASASADERGALRRAFDACFGVYALAGFGLMALVALVVVTLVPGAQRRSRLVSATIRVAFVAAGTRPEITGRERIPADRCVLVANHASYLDGLVLKGFLPARFAFVIKGEMRNIPVVHFLLRRSGSHFVERFDASGSSRDARRIVKAARRGEALGFFPEGTFRGYPGVGRFHKGAFVAAIRSGMPVVPIAIRGTRHILPDGRRLPRPGRIRIAILEPIDPADPAFADSATLAEAARQRILVAVDEPDLLERQA